VVRGRPPAAAPPAADAAAPAADGAQPTAPVAPVRATVVAASGEPMNGLKLLGPVKYERSEAGRYATATYVGYMAELETVRNALRAWTLTQGEELTGLPFEIYKNGIDQAFTANGRYDVYWALKK
jgi:predicted transcriptional regulator YdeE